MIDWLTSFQIFAAIWVVSAVGFLVAFLKLFNPRDVYDIRRLVYLVPMAAMLFREIGNSTFNAKTWISFAHALIIQVIMHLIVLVYCLIYRKDEPFITRFIKMSIAVCEKDFIYIAYPIAPYLFTSSLASHAALAAFVQFIVVNPFHQLLSIFFVDDCVTKFNRKHEPLDPVHPLDVHEDSTHGEEEELSDQDLDSKKVKFENVVEHDNHGNPAKLSSHSDSQENKSTDSKPEEEQNAEVNIDLHNNSNEEESESVPNDVPQATSTEKPTRSFSRNILILLAFVNQWNICAIIGIIWSIF